MREIAVIGCGVQGTAVVERLLAAGHRVTVFDREVVRARDAAALGASVAPDAAAAIAAAEHILTVVTAGPAVRDVLLDPRNLAALGPGQLVIQMGTQSPEDARVCRQAVEATGAELAAAILHGPRAAILAGQVLLLAGGSPEQHARVRRVLAPLGTAAAVGTVEQAAAFNAAGLCLLYALMHGFAVGAAMVERSGTAVEAWCDHVRGAGNLMGFMADFMWPAHFAARSYELVGPCQFRNEGALQETVVMGDLAAALGLDGALVASFVAAHRAAYRVSADADFSSVYDVLAPPGR